MLVVLNKKIVNNFFILLFFKINYNMLTRENVYPFLKSFWNSHFIRYLFFLHIRFFILNNVLRLTLFFDLLLNIPVIIFSFNKPSNELFCLFINSLYIFLYDLPYLLSSIKRKSIILFFSLSNSRLFPSSSFISKLLYNSIKLSINLAFFSSR